MDLNDLKNEIIKVPQSHPVFIYVGVGAAAGMLNASGILPPEHYQQFPPFLQELRNTIPNIHLFLLLIDPQQENPPYVAVDYKCQHEVANAVADAVANEVGANANAVVPSIDQFKNPADNLNVFVCRQMVYTDPDINHNDKAINITETLKDLNFFAKETNASLLYHDFTGRHVGLLAEYFDNTNIVKNLDQIVYGFSAREDLGCLFDLTQPSAFFPYRLDYNNNRLRPIIKLFNYYHYIANNNFNQAHIVYEINKFPEKMRLLATIQKEQIINNIRTRFKEIYLNTLRQLRKKDQEQQDNQEEAFVEGELYIFNSLPHPYREMFSDLYKEKEFNMISEMFFHFCANQLNIMSQLRQMDISGEEMLQLITADTDPFKWYNNIKSFM